MENSHENQNSDKLNKTKENNDNNKFKENFYESPVVLSKRHLSANKNYDKSKNHIVINKIKENFCNINKNYDKSKNPKPFFDKNIHKIEGNITSKAKENKYNKNKIICNNVKY